MENRRAGGARNLDKRARVIGHPDLLHHALNRPVERATLRREVVLMLERGGGGVSVPANSENRMVPGATPSSF